MQREGLNLFEVKRLMRKGIGGLRIERANLYFKELDEMESGSRRLIAMGRIIKGVAETGTPHCEKISIKERTSQEIKVLTEVQEYTRDAFDVLALTKLGYSKVKSEVIKSEDGNYIEFKLIEVE